MSSCCAVGIAIVVAIAICGFFLHCSVCDSLLANGPYKRSVFLGKGRNGGGVSIFECDDESRCLLNEN